MKIRDIQLDKDKIYILCGMNQGDTFATINLRRKLEEKYQAEIVFIVKDYQEHIARLIGDDRYIVIEDRNDEYWEEIYKLTDACQKPTKGKIFVADFWVYKDSVDSFNTMRAFYNYFFDLPVDNYFTYRVKQPELNMSLRHRVTMIAPLDKIVMFCPDAHSSGTLNSHFWEELAGKLKSEGFTVISSVMSKESAINGTEYLDMNVEDALQLAYNCHSVYALRSGFCDLCVGLREKLTVLYPAQELYDTFSFANNYDIHDIEEKVISTNN